MSPKLQQRSFIIKYIPLQQGLRLYSLYPYSGVSLFIIKYIPLQQGLRLCRDFISSSRNYY